MNDLPPKALWFYAITITLLILILVGVYGRGRAETRVPLHQPFTLPDPNHCYKQIIQENHNQRAIRELLLMGTKENETKT